MKKLSGFLFATTLSIAAIGCQGENPNDAEVRALTPPGVPGTPQPAPGAPAYAPTPGTDKKDEAPATDAPKTDAPKTEAPADAPK